MASLWSLLVLLAFKPVLSARIAGFSGFGGSQYIMMRNIMKELQSRGHEVTLVVDSAQRIKSNDGITHKTYQVPYKRGFTEEIVVKVELEGSKMEMFWRICEVFNILCESLLNSTELLEDLKSFDLIVYDSSAPGAVFVGEKFDIPRVEILPAPPNSPMAIYHRLPMPVSYVPQLMLGFSSNMTFLQRVINLGAYFSAKLFLNLAYARLMNILKIKYNIKPEKSFEDAVNEAELLLIAADFALEYPQPLLPGNIMVGPLNVKPPKCLPPDLEKFVNNSGGHGFIIVSFGTNLASILEKNKVDMLASAFAKLKQKVLWRVKGYLPSNIATNINVVNWLPQNDLLGHKEIKAFVSHVGHNSLYESAYHGVPLVGFPLFGDQHSNAKKMEQFGLGLAVDHNTVDSQELFETIARVISEPRFKAKATRISRLLKDSSRSPLEKAGDWIEYVIRHDGARHLRPEVFNIRWYQYYLVDVIALLMALHSLINITVKFIYRYLIRTRRQNVFSRTKYD